MALILAEGMAGMPISYAAWQLDEETEDQAWELLPGSDQSWLATMASKQRRQQSAGARLALRHLFNEHGLKYKGYNYQHHDPPPFVSLSHTDELSVAAISFERKLGIDIEKPQDRIIDVASRFLSADELQNFPSSQYVWLWAAKEAVWKWARLRGISYQHDLTISGQSALSETAVPSLQANIKYQGQVIKISLYCKWLLGHCLVIVH